VVVDVAGEISLKVIAPVGPRGENGRTILNGTGPPQNSQGVDGDFYLNTASWLLHGPKANDAWPVGVSLTGSAGEDGTHGTNGLDGRTILNGAGAPEGNQGDDGDFYIDRSAMVIYGPKAGGFWPGGVSLVGPPGTNGIDGRTILNGAGAPSNATGSSNDFYLDRTTHVLYGPKMGGVWPSGVPLIGPPGEDGADGVDGQDGVDGVDGQDGGDGQDGAPGADGRTILSGSGARSGVGAAGDFYIDTVADAIYGPKSASTGWGSGR
jgi:hypothetical protein